MGGDEIKCWRFVATLLLMFIGGYAALAQTDKISDLIQQLKSQNAFERLRAIRTLVELHDPEAVEPLIRFLQDRNADHRINAIIILRQLKDSRAVLPLMQLLKEDSDLQVRRESAKALGDLRDRRAVPLFAELLAEHDSEIQVAAEVALEKLGEKN
jgi:HEAT repeat protein